LIVDRRDAGDGAACMIEKSFYDVGSDTERGKVVSESLPMLELKPTVLPRRARLWANSPRERRSRFKMPFR